MNSSLINTSTQNFLAQVQELNRISIPKPIVDFLKIKRGDYVVGTIWKVQK
jgi:bifunctional DNA-binding transcriptional regulator/antitoxin component of YhaV-PrlF toxin-antitoxin module